MKQKNNSGFTLVELLVAISIIGFLASAAIYALNSARKEARDAQRLSDVKTIQKALEMYYDDNKAYPPVIAYTYPDDSDCGVNWCKTAVSLGGYLSPYLKTMPNDPLGNGQANYKYHYKSSSGNSYQTYGLMVRLEHPKNFSLVNDGGYAPWAVTTGAWAGAYYEVGDQPSYCSKKYTGADGNWFGGGATINVCVGGN